MYKYIRTFLVKNEPFLKEMFQAGCCLFFIIFLISKQYQSFKGCCVPGRTVEGPYTKKECHTNYQKFRNLLSTLMKKNKQAYYDKYFERNWNNVKNTWKVELNHWNIGNILSQL